MKKRAAGAKLKKRLAELVEHNSTVQDTYDKPKRKTRRDLEVELEEAHQVIANNRYAIGEAMRKLETQKQEFQQLRTSRELEMKAKLTEGAAHMIEALARMIGGPGF